MRYLNSMGLFNGGEGLVVVILTPAQLTLLPLWKTDSEKSESSSRPGMSEAMALALRAREAAQWEDEGDDEDFQPWAGTINNKC